jgi:hypothetical protein
MRQIASDWNLPDLAPRKSGAAAAVRGGIVLLDKKSLEIL